MLCSSYSFTSLVFPEGQPFESPCCVNGRRKPSATLQPWEALPALQRLEHFQHCLPSLPPPCRGQRGLPELWPSCINTSISSSVPLLGVPQFCAISTSQPCLVPLLEAVQNDEGQGVARWPHCVWAGSGKGSGDKKRERRAQADSGTSGLL